MNRQSIAAICCLAGGWLLLGGKLPTPEPDKPVAEDVLSKCYEADRKTKVFLIREMASKEFPNDQRQAEWWNEQIDEARQRDFQPFVDAVSEAIVAETLPALADSLEVAE